MYMYIEFQGCVHKANIQREVSLGKGYSQTHMPLSFPDLAHHWDAIWSISLLYLDYTRSNLFQGIATGSCIKIKKEQQCESLLCLCSLNSCFSKYSAFNTKLTCIVYTAWIQQLGTSFRTWQINNLFIYMDDPKCSWHKGFSLWYKVGHVISFCLLHNAYNV